MKKFFKSALVACAALAVVACQNNPVVGPEKGTKSITVKISQNSSTRGMVTPLYDGADVYWAEAALFFADGEQIIKTVKVTKDGASDENNAKYSELEAGRVFHNLPATVSQVYFGANLSSFVYTTVDALKKTAYGIDVLFEMERMPIFGFDTTLDVAADSPDEADGNKVVVAEIYARPLGARFELPQVEADEETDANYIASFNVKGIYLDNIYTTINLDGTTTQTAPLGGPVAGATSNASYNYPNATWHKQWYSMDYYTPGEEAVVDDTTTTDVNEAKPATDPVYLTDLSGIESMTWGYSLPAPGVGSYTAATEDAGPVWGFEGTATLPYIIIEVTDVVRYDGTTLDGDWFLTYKLNSTTVTDLEQGKVYKVGGLTFREGDLTSYPYAAGLDVEVTVEIMDWEVVDVPYIFY